MEVKEDRHTSLEKVLMNAKQNEHNLFLAAEKGEGKFENDATVVINPKTKDRARKWLMEEYLMLIFQEEEDTMLTTSVDPEEQNNNSKYSESLKEFLKPTMQNAYLNNKKYGKKIRSHAQVIGVNNETARKEKKDKRIKENTKKKESAEITSALMSEMIKCFKEQIEELKNIIGIVCTSVVIDEETKKLITNKMNKMKEAPIDEIENKDEIEVE